jgi:hypothetical protein
MHPAGEKIMEPLGIDLGEKRAEGVMGGDCLVLWLDNPERSL